MSSFSSPVHASIADESRSLPRGPGTPRDRAYVWLRRLTEIARAAAFPVSEPPARGDRASYTPCDGWTHPEHDGAGFCHSGLSPQTSAYCMVPLFLRARSGPSLSAPAEPRAQSRQFSAGRSPRHRLCILSGSALEHHGGLVSGVFVAT